MALKLSASSAERLMSCPASADLPAAIPGWTQPAKRVGMAADKGTDKHEILEKLVGLPAKEINGMAKILQYIADLRSTRRFKVLIEEEIQTTWLTRPGKTTADLVLYTQDQLDIIDYKWGKILVEAIGNPQGLFYGVSYAALAPKAKGFTFHLLQPLADNYSSWFADTNVLAKFKEDALAAEQLIIKGDRTFGPSDHGCTFCPANPQSRGEKAGPYCPALMQIFYPKVVDEDAILNL